MSKMIDLATVIGIYAICNTGAILLHQIDYANEKVKISLNGEGPEWTDLTEGYADGSSELETGFRFGEMFIPLADIIRF